MSLREQILGFDDPYLKLRPEVVPEWDLTVYVRGWTAKERETFENDFGDLDKAGRANLRSRIVVRAVLDETGARIFADADADALGEKNSVVIDRLFNLVMDLGKVGGNKGERLKNSPGGPAASSP